MSNNAVIIKQQATSNKQQATSNKQQATNLISALKILVCCHKPCTMPPNDDGILLPIQAGKALTDLDLHIQADNEVNGQPCDNISERNPEYCELTVLYWAWKNLKKLYPDVKYIGLYHYRRFFAFNEKRFFAPDIAKPEEAILNYRFDAEKIIKILESGKIILVKPYVFSYTLELQYCMSAVSKDYRNLEGLIKEKYPDYYDAFIDVMKRNNKLAARNMFIMKYEDFVKYCEWLFAVTDDFDSMINYQGYDISQKRSPGVMAERLLNVYVRKHKMKAKYFSVFFYGDAPKPEGRLKRFLSDFRSLLNIFKYNTAMFILNLNARPLRRLLKKFPLKL